MRQILKITATLIIIGGIFTTYYFLNGLTKEFQIIGNNPILLTETGQVGNFIGGVVGTIFSLAGFLLLILTLSEQTRFATKERFESKFFDLLRLHRENVKELESNNSSGRKEYYNIFMQFLKCREDISTAFSRLNEKHIYEPDYLKELKQDFSFTNPNIDFLDLSKFNLAYLVTFYGVSSEGKTTLHDILKGKYKEQFITKALDFIAMKPVEESNYFSNWESVMKLNRPKKKVQTFELIRKLRNNENIEGKADIELIEKAKEQLYQSNYIKFYGGHQYQLGHYFRHLYQTFTFINQQKFLSKKEKYFYAKTLRAQLSTHEQALLFINSISLLGLTWDLVPKVSNKYFDWILKILIKRKRLITNFNLIKNLPGQEIFGIKYKDYYPDIEYEHSKK